MNGTPDRVIRISSERKWPERIVFDTSAPMPRVTATASPVQVNPAQETAAVIPDRAREALAQLQIPDAPQMQMDRPKKQEEKQEARRWQKFAKKHVARPPLRIARHSQYAWFGGRMWW
ncbi:MAG TPA: hypothetical protein VFL62_17655 [Bradyrhizobium sp.]|uniref:hypothetical protein n=1 Tax=Bradyrhizobium sp. TaxID=376 RepID=UPI002D7F7C33|nr:hypothetical protein [Bradyrhizobium sp.]HET7888053.1 hypothetical protein [Bradyrhizobium sp.]